MEPLAPSTVAALLGAAATIIRTEISALPAAVPTWHPAGGERCVHEILGHVIEAEKRGFAGRIRVILSNDSPRFEGWDQDAVARDRKDCGRDWAGLWEEFSALRAGSVQLVAGLGLADLPRGGRHPKVGFRTVGDRSASRSPEPGAQAGGKGRGE